MIFPRMSMPPRKQRGAAAVEFALITVGFLTVFFGIIEFGRVLFMMNTTVEATRLGARIAVVCDKDSSAIVTKMTGVAGFLSPSHIQVSYEPAGCDVNSCHYATVSVSGLTISTLVPLIPFDFEMPAFSTTLPRESMSSASNPICA